MYVPIVVMNISLYIKIFTSHSCDNYSMIAKQFCGTDTVRPGIIECMSVFLTYYYKVYLVVYCFHCICLFVFPLLLPCCHMLCWVLEATVAKTLCFAEFNELLTTHYCFSILVEYLPMHVFVSISVLFPIFALKSPPISNYDDNVLFLYLSISFINVVYNTSSCDLSSFNLPLYVAYKH